jgi:hypothetical protein
LGGLWAAPKGAGARRPPLAAAVPAAGALCVRIALGCTTPATQSHPPHPPPTPPPPAGYSIDVSIPALRVAIEADGPSHIARNKRRPGGGGGAATGPGGGPPAGTVQLGATLMKARHLRALGWRVVNVTFEEWDALGSAAAREAFLRARIAAAG